MANIQVDKEEAFLEYLERRNYVSALDGESLRTEYRRKRTSIKDLTMLSLLVRKGMFTTDHAEQLHKLWTQTNSALDRIGGEPPTPTPLAVAPTPAAQPPKAPPAPIHQNPAMTVMDEIPDLDPGDIEDESSVIADTETRKAPEPRKSTDKHTTNRKLNDSGTKRPTDKKTANVEDSRSGTGRSTTNQDTKQRAAWSIHADSDAIGATDKIVPAGTIISGGPMTIAQVRQHIGIGGGVKLVSNKMESSLAHMQHDATEDKKRYVVIREIARGGMGKVLEVEDTELRRSVALKVLRKELVNRRDVVERFLEEAQITGQLEHPNIVPVHEMGVDGAGNLYFTMKYVEGHALSEILQKLREGNRDSLREYPLLKLLDIFVKICEGMAFAHNRGVIHRDLKPANVMVGKFGEVQVMDWGVAKIVGKEFRAENDSGIVVTDRFDADAVHTMLGSIIGTPSYMSPEQARGEVERIGATTDIFSLGVMLYEMLALRSPWTGKTSDEVLEQVRTYTPVRPTERNPEVMVPAEIERLCLKCLEKEPENRLASVKELAENLRSFIEGRTMGSVEYSIFRLAWKWVGRHFKEVAFMFLAVLLLAGGILGTLWYIRTLETERILGKNDSAQLLLSEWEELANNGKYDEAQAKVEEARRDFQAVLAVNETDPTALTGVAAVDTATARIRQMQLQHEAAVLEKRRVKALTDEARKQLDLGLKDPVVGESKLKLAIQNADAAMAIVPELPDAKDIKAAAAEELAKRAMRMGRWYVADLWLEVWRGTAMRAEARIKLELDLARRRSE